MGIKVIHKVKMKTNTKIMTFLGVAAFSFGLMSNINKASAASISVTTSGPQEITIWGGGDNTVLSSDDVTVLTSCRSGYNFVISTSVNNNNLYLDGDINNNTDGTFFTPSDGLTPLSSSTNTWGYYFNEATAPTKASIFNAVPALGNSAVIKAPLETPSDTDISDSFSIYYGVSVSSAMKSGTYKMIPDVNDGGNDGAIVYQATIADACMRYTVIFNPTDTYTGSAVTGTGTMASQSIYEGVATTLNSNTFTAPTGYEFVGWNTAQDGSGTTYANGASVTDLALAGENVTLYAMWSDCANGICYQQNGEDVVGTMGKQTVTADTAAPLFASNFSRTGYGFAGWSDVSDYETNQNAHFYGPMEDYTASASALVRGVKLYAVWVASAGSLQDADKVAELCGTTTTDNILTKAPTDGTANLSSVSALTDQRDNQTYAIAKLADGKCWMIENLRLDNQYTVGNNQTDSSVTNASLSQGYNPSFIGLADPESDNFSDSTTANSLYSIDGSTASTISGSDQGYRFPRYNNNNTSQRAESTTNTNVNTYSYGNYYTWAAVIADTTHYTSGDHNTTSICPKGWHIPTGRTSGEYYTLNTNANAGATNTSRGLRSYPTNFLYSGYFSTSSANYMGSFGYYWSSTAGGASSSYFLFLHSIVVDPGTGGNNKYYGYTARCVFGP